MVSKFSFHIPVLLQESLDLLALKPGDRILDCTLGLGGHASAFLKSVNGNAELVALDTDKENLEIAKENMHLQTFKPSNLQTFIHANFRDLPSLSLGTFDVIFADLGVSSVHFDDPDRGFSFRADGPLDMRLDQSTGQTAAELIQETSEEDLANIFFQYGEIRQSRKLAAALKASPPFTTSDLTSVCEKLFSFRAKPILAQVFQSLRIAVNDELSSLEVLLDTAPTMLNAGGRLGIISFHSLEDRMVKQKFRVRTTAEKDEHTGQDLYEPPFEELTHKAIKPSEAEIARNPRARSARLRGIRKR